MKTVTNKLLLVPVLLLFLMFALPAIGVNAEQTTETVTTETSQTTEPATEATTETPKVTAPSKEKKETVVIKEQPKVVLNKKSISLERKQTKKLKATKKNHAPSGKILWSSSNKKVATVDSKGKVKAKKKGTCKITARIKGTKIKAVCKVTVKPYVTMRVKTTAYCGCYGCNGGYKGTASGKPLRANHTIAVDRRLIPFGTKVQIGGKNYYAEDTGVKGKIIDIYFSSHRQVCRYGVKYRNVKVFYK